MFLTRNLMVNLKKHSSCFKIISIQARNYCAQSQEKPDKKINLDQEETDKNQSNKNKKEKAHEDYVKQALILKGGFEHASNKDKETYKEMIKIFEAKDKHRRNHVEFIYAALKNMEAFGVQKDLATYKALINVMPKGKFIPQNIFQAEFMHYPKQQQCIIDLLEKMEDNGVIPDYEMEDMLVNIFGRKGHPVRKFWRMMYWMPKFKNLSPWSLPNPVPDETLDLAKLAVERMCSIDVQSKISTYQTKTVESAIDDTWIVSGQSVEQKELLAKHDKKSALHIEGPFLIWLRNKSINYFILRSEPNTFPEEEEEDIDDVSRIEVPIFGFGSKKGMRNKIALKRSVHEQEDGTIYSICCTGTSTKDSLLSWIRLLEKDGNPELSTIPVLFKFRSAIPNQLTVVTEEKIETIQPTEKR